MITTNVQLETGEERRELIRRVLDGLDDSFSSRLKEAKSIFLKVNLVDAERALASTHVDAVRGVLDAIRYHTQAPVFIGDASYVGTPFAFRQLGYEHLEHEYESVRLVDLNDDDFVEQTVVREDGSEVKIRRARMAIEADYKISLTPLKIHDSLGAALSITNWTIGTWLVPSRISASGRVWARWPWTDGEGSSTHHRMIAAMQKQFGFDLAVIDGFSAMEGCGPVEGDVVSMHLALAGTDAFAVDSVAATLIGIDPGDIGYLSLGSQDELGVTDLARIDVPPMLLSECTRVFRTPLGFLEKITAWKASVDKSTEA